MYVCGMVRKVPKTFTLPLDVVERLEDEDNQSQTVATALREHFQNDE